MQSQQARDFPNQRQRAQVLDGEAAAYCGIVFGDVGEHFLNLSLNAVLDGLRWRRIVEFMFVNCLQALAGMSVAATYRAAHR